MKVLFIHYLIGERDGVSLEIEKRAEAYRNKGFDVYYLGGKDGLERPNTFVVPEILIKNDWNLQFIKSAFETFDQTEESLLKTYQKYESEIYNNVYRILEELKPDLIYVHNVFSHAYNLPATFGIIRALDKYKIKTVVVNHDFWYEREKFLHSPFKFIQDILSQLPPDRDYIIKHQVINSIAEEELYKRRNIKAHRIGDYFNFDIIHAEKDTYNSDVKECLGIKEDDLVVLQATRITERKGIENAIRFVKVLQEKLRLMDRVEIRGKVFTKESKVYLLLTNFIEVDAKDYSEKLKNLAKHLDVNVIWASNKFMPERGVSSNNQKVYSFWDAYLMADLVTYPSLLEGFGNQFLEAIYFRLLPVVFEYPVFLKDIKNEGYEYISLENIVNITENGLNFVPDETILKAVTKTIQLLQDQSEYSRITENNYKIAKLNHNHGSLEKDIDTVISRI
jgi:glycosyltransferase involved in cell wall biosynthesis